MTRTLILSSLLLLLTGCFESKEEIANNKKYCGSADSYVWVKGLFRKDRTPVENITEEVGGEFIQIVQYLDSITIYTEPDDVINYMSSNTTREDSHVKVLSLDNYYWTMEKNDNALNINVKISNGCVRVVSFMESKINILYKKPIQTSQFLSMGGILKSKE